MSAATGHGGRKVATVFPCPVPAAARGQQQGVMKAKASKKDERPRLLRPAAASKKEELLRRRTACALQKEERHKAKAQEKLAKAAIKAADKAVKAKAKAAAKPKARAKAKAKATAKARAKVDPNSRAKKRVSRTAKTSGADAEGASPSAKRCRMAGQDLEIEVLDDAGTTEAQAVLGGQSVLSSDLASWVARATGLQLRRVAGAVRLFTEGNTLPFIARYRKEKTGSMNEEELRRVERELRRAEAMEAKRLKVALALHRRGELSSELRAALLGATAVEEIEDLWAPFRTKRQTRAEVARARGLAPLAELLRLGGARGQGPEDYAASFVGPDEPDVRVALAGARDILAEQCAHRPDIKQRARDLLEGKAFFRARRRQEADEEGRFRNYWNFEAPLSRVRPHQFLAAKRGEAAKALSLSFSLPAESTDNFVEGLVTGYSQKGVRSRTATSVPSPLRGRHGTPVLRSRAELARPWNAPASASASAWEQELRAAMVDAFRRLILPSLEREWLRRLREQAEDEAFDTYRRNLRAKLLAPPLRLHPEWGDASHGEPVAAVLGIDPAYRTGCKLALISMTGQVLATKTVFPHPPYPGCAPSSAAFVEARAASKASLAELLLLARFGAERKEPGDGSRLVCSIGNGTASRETEAWLRDLLTEGWSGIGYAVVDEAGASIYSASPLAAAELPSLDVCLRGAVSIARRLLDPLSELVKIDPQSIGVGLYQHDVDQRRLAQELRGGTEDCVNAVGVDLNTASPVLLEHVAGLSASLAQAVVSHRSQHGAFRCRDDLLAVRGIGQRAFHQAVGFLRVHGGSEPLDELPVHPESYSIARELQRSFGSDVGRLKSAGDEVKRLAVQLEVGAETLADIAAALAGTVDPRSRLQPARVKMPVGAFAASIPGGPGGTNAVDAQEIGLRVQELQPGMRLEGVVRNVVAFGAFVDVGVGHDGLLHVSQYPRQGKDDLLSVNDRIEVSIVSTEQRGGPVGKERWRIGLSMRV
ncbi:unnamed protein product [Polarella glacialis]|uniref:S1 motif domain-containing protein n=1 Tax=Polarella glacialis TaxID=89957 RepID=A0A813FLV0_POLGL|nr:unnamed protein product [Polarella glacialis]